MKKGFIPTKVTPEIQKVMDEDPTGKRSPIVAKLLIEQRRGDKENPNAAVDFEAVRIKQEIGCPTHEARYRAKVKVGVIAEVPYEPEPFKLTEKEQALRKEFVDTHRRRNGTA